MQVHVGYKHGCMKNMKHKYQVTFSFTSTWVGLKEILTTQLNAGSFTRLLINVFIRLIINKGFPINCRNKSCVDNL